MAMALAGLHQQLRPFAEQAIEIAKDNGIPVTITSVVRGLEQQQRLRANYDLCVSKGLQGKNVSLTPGYSCQYPANRPGDSAHNFGLAWDSITTPERQADWNYIRRWVGWHVPENDRIHAELPNWRAYLVPA